MEKLRNLGVYNAPPSIDSSVHKQPDPIQCQNKALLQRTTNALQTATEAWTTEVHPQTWDPARVGNCLLISFWIRRFVPSKKKCTFTARFPSLTHSNLCMGRKKQLDWLQLLSAGAHVKWTVRTNEKYVCLIALSQHGKTKRKMRNNNEQCIIIIIIVWLHYLSACQLNIHQKSSSV